MKCGETTGATNEALAASEAVRSARRAPSKVGWLANEKRLSCAAVLCCSQKQFYYDGRRQLQPLVRQTRDDTEQSPTEIRQELWPSVRQGIP